MVWRCSKHNEKNCRFIKKNKQLTYHNHQCDIVYQSKNEILPDLTTRIGQSNF